MRLVLLVLLALAAVPAASAQAATSVRLGGGGPVIVGDAGPNRIGVSAADEGRVFVIEDPAGLAVGDGCTADGPSRARCPRVVAPPSCEGEDCYRFMSSVSVSGGAGDDDVRVGYGPAAEGWPATGASVNGGAGNDFVGGTPTVDYGLSGGPGDDVVDGAGSDDELSGGGGIDRLYGGLARDKLIDGDGPALPPSRRVSPVDGDVLDGGPCREPACAPAGPDDERDAEDVVDYGTRKRPVKVSLRTEAPVQGQRGEGDVVRGVEVVYGGLGDDRLTAGTRPSRLIGGAGDDVLDATGDGVSFVGCEGQGFDTVAADRGDDVFDCATRCPAIAGCPRPRLTIAGLPRECARRPFRVVITVRGVPRIRSVRANVTGFRLGPARGRRLRATIPVKRRSTGFRDIRVVVARAGGGRIVLRSGFYACG